MTTRRGRLGKFAPLAILGAFALVSGGCAELDISNAGAIDFQTYRTVSFDLQGDVAPDHSAYFEAELREHSGFEDVVSYGDVHLSVHVGTQFEVEYDDDTNTTSTNWNAYANWTLFDATGRVLLDGREEDSSESAYYAVEKALDEVVVIFLEPYDY